MFHDYQWVFVISTVLYTMAFIVWSRLAHAIRNAVSLQSAICFMPMVLATGIKAVASGCLAVSTEVTMVGVEKFGALTNPFMALGALLVGVWGLFHVRCQDVECSRSRMGLFFRELVKSIPD